MRDSDVAVVVVTYNAEAVARHGACGASRHRGRRPRVDRWVARDCRSFAHDRVVEQENKGVGAGWNRGIAETTEPYVLLLNADAWALRDAVDASPLRRRTTRAALVGRRLLNPDGTLQRSARLPSAVAARDRVLLPPQAGAAHARLNAFYAGTGITSAPRGRVALRAGDAGSAGGDRAGRRARRVVLHVQRGVRLAVPDARGRLGGLVLPGCRGGARRRWRDEARVGPDVLGAGAESRALRPQAPRARRRRADARSCFCRCCCAGSSSEANAAGATGRRRARSRAS